MIAYPARPAKRIYGCKLYGWPQKWVMRIRTRRHWLQCGIT